KYKESEARFHSLIESTNDWVWEVDKNEVYTYASPKIIKILGYKPDELIGKRPYDLMPSEEARRVRERFKKIIDTGKPFTALTNTNIHKEGRHVILETNGVPFFDVNGNLMGFIGTDRDITKRKQAEVALQKSEEKFRNLIENINDWLWEIDENNIFTYSSPLSHKLLGYNSDELVGVSMFDLISNDDVLQVKETLKYSAETGDPFVDMENIVFHKNGTEIFMDTSGTPIFDSDGCFRGYRGIGRDIRERKLVEDAFIKAKRSLRARNICNNALIHSSTEAQFLLEICRLMVETLGYRFSWVGFAKDDVMKNVKLIAQFGYEEEDLETLNITWADTEMGCDIIAMAIRTGEFSIAQNILENSKFKLCRTHALKQGYASVIVLPLLANKKIFGVLNVYSIESNAFDDDEIHLLQSLTNDLVYGITALRDAAERKRAEETLRQNERFLQDVFDAIQDGIRVLDRNFNVVRTNAWMEKMYSSLKPLDNKKYYTDYQNELSSHSCCPSPISIKTGKTHSEIAPYPSAENPIMWNEITTFPLKNDEGVVTGIIEYIKDITERKQAEMVLEEYNRTLEREVEERTEAVVENNALMYATLESTADGILVVSNEREVLLYNQKFIDMWNIPTTIINEKDNWEMVSFVSQQMKEPEQYISKAKQVRSHPDTEHYDLLEFKDGRFYERYSKPYQLDKKTVGRVMSFRDITQRKQVEEALRKSEHKYRSILAHTSEGYWLMDANSKTLEVNESLCQMLNYTQTEMIGKTPFEFVDDENRKIFKNKMRQRQKTHQRSYEINLMTKHGTTIPTWFNATTIMDDVNNLIASFAFITNLTEHKRTEKTLAQAKEAAEAASRAKSEFLANMSHELRTPLNGILGFAQILQHDKTLNSQQIDAICTIQQSGEHLLTLLNDILDMSKVEAGKMELNFNCFHFHHFLRSIADIIQIRAQQKGIIFTIEFSKDLPIAVNSDETRLRQILVNLLGNAIKFTDQGQVIFKVNSLNISNSIQSAKMERKIHFQVEDTGHGIAQDELTTIFQPFHQVGDHKRKSEGTGLGLPISKKLVEMMESTLNLKSTLGKGSTFWFDLVLSEESGWQSVDNTSKRSIIGFKGKPYRILVIDDQEANRILLTHLLSPLGFNVSEAVNGQDGIKKALSEPPDLILMDLIMPVMNGLETTRKIRQSSELKEIVIIAVSASAFKKHQEDSIAAGCNDFIAKPIQTDDLLDKLRKYLNLEWIFYEPPTLETSSLQTKEQMESMVGPPIKEAKILYKLAMQGNVDGIIEQVTQLEKNDSKYQPFATELRQLANEFKIRKIRELVKHYL
ncbi:PAS domain S-box protein, partial [Candidatus Parabeggiatoa sp. HSG14]|uniref:PAS domain S-box protein n=1 Tax=Candidatus Parabeggiatoa sp. HSG14 TaxID=3055593 RepID=UPI0025A7611C|nr:PAS domain S-box protein [Thiotrichales bacterium HSG14]